MNEANDFYEDMRSRHQAVLNWREKNSAVGSSVSGDEQGAGVGGGGGGGGGGDVRSGNGSANGEKRVGQTRNGTKSQPDPAANLSPNG